jgi:hypothetical protein
MTTELMLTELNTKYAICDTSARSFWERDVTVVSNFCTGCVGTSGPVSMLLLCAGNSEQGVIRICSVLSPRHSTCGTTVLLVVYILSLQVLRVFGYSASYCAQEANFILARLSSCHSSGYGMVLGRSSAVTAVRRHYGQHACACTFSTPFSPACCVVSLRALRQLRISTSHAIQATLTFTDMVAMNGSIRHAIRRALSACLHPACPCRSSISYSVQDSHDCDIWHVV